MAFRPRSRVVLAMAEPRQSLSAEAMALAMRAEGASAKLRTNIRQIFQRRRAYLKLFFDAQGALKPEARVVLRDLLDASDFGRAAPDLDNGTLQLLEGKRWMVLHLFGRFRLPEGRLTQLEKTLRETEDDEE